MFLINQKSVTLLTHISPIPSSKMTHSKTQSLLFKKLPTLIALMLFSVPASTEESLAAVPAPFCTGHPSNFSRLLYILNPFSTCPTAYPSLKSKQEPLLSTITLHHTLSQQIPKQPIQNPLAVSQVTIGNQSLTTACWTHVYWPQRTVSSHPGFTMLLLTVSCKAVWKTFLKSKHLTTTVFFQPTRSVAVSQKEKRLVSGDWLLTNTCQLSCSHPCSLQGVYDPLFDCLFHVLAGIQLDYKSLGSAVSPCYG